MKRGKDPKIVRIRQTLAGGVNDLHIAGLFVDGNQAFEHIYDRRIVLLKESLQRELAIRSLAQT